MLQRVLVTALGCAAWLAPVVLAQEEPATRPAMPLRRVTQDPESPIHALTVSRIDGTPTRLATYKGKVCLIVNVASQCGLTPQYEALEALHQKYAPRGFTVLAFPSNDFNGQEPGTDEQIASFCKEKYGVTFPVFSKVSVKGDQQAPLYRYLTTKSAFPGDVTWNFQKYLVDASGKVIARFDPRTKPDDPEVVSAIEAALRARDVSATAKPGAKFEGGPTAAADALKAAVERAAAEDKKVFVHFSADWCGWCKKLEAFMAMPEMKPLFEQDFVDVKIATDRMEDGQALLDKHAEGKRTGIPFMVILDEKGDVLARSFDEKGQNIGYPFQPGEIDAFMKIFQAHAKRATQEQIGLVRKTFQSLGAKPKEK